MSSSPTSIPVSIFAGLKDNSPLLGDLQYPEGFDEWHDIRAVEDRKNVPLWSPVTYKPGKERRKNETWENVDTVNALVLDYDGKDPQPTVFLDEAQQAWGPVEHVIHTTGRHTPEAPRFRMVFPLDRPAKVPEEFSRIWRAIWLIAKAKGVTFDPLADAGRMYFVPTRRVDVDNEAEYRHNPGEVLSVDTLIKVQKKLDPNFIPKAVGKGASSSPSAPSPAGASPLSGGSAGQGSGVFAGIDKLHQREDWERIKEQCAFAKHIEDDAATLSEPEWYAGLSLVVRCKDGDALIHSVSAAHPGYDRASTEEKAERALKETGPVTCARAHVLSGLCSGCPAAAADGTMKSPVQLGAPDPATATEEELREDRRARAQAALARAEEELAFAKKMVAEAAVKESELRSAAKFQEKYAVTAEEAAEAGKAHAEAKERLLAAKEQLKFADSAAKKARVAARVIDGADAVDPAIFDQLSLSPTTGSPLPTFRNLVTILREDPMYAGKYRYDLFHERVCYLDSFGADHLDGMVRESIEERYGLVPQKAVLQDATLQVAHENEFHPVQDYLNSLEWDGEARLKDLMVMGLGGYGEDPEFLAEAGTKMCISAAARVMSPKIATGGEGVKVDEMVVLVGKQGAGKSKGLRALACGWFADTHIDIGTKDGLQALAGKWFYEIAELDSFRKAEASRIKAFISSQVDHYRPPYAHHPIDRPRQTILVGSTNEEEFLNDPTGSRRFVPVHVTTPDQEWVLANRDQLWAEAVVRYTRGEEWWYEQSSKSAERLKKMSEKHQRKDVWETSIRSWLVLSGRSRTHVTTVEALTQAVTLPLSQIDHRHKMRMGAVLVSLGCVRERMTSGKRGYGYAIPEALLDADDDNIIPGPWTPNAGTNGGSA